MMFPGLHPAAMMSTVGASMAPGPNHNPSYGYSSHQQQMNNHHLSIRPGANSAGASGAPAPSNFANFGAYHHQPMNRLGQNSSNSNAAPGAASPAANPMPGFFATPAYGGQGVGMNSGNPGAQETVYLFVPNTSVGALIGAKGNYIR